MTSLADLLRQLPSEERIWLVIYNLTGSLPDHWTETPQSAVSEAPVFSAREHREKCDRLMREIVRRFGPRTASTNAKVNWLTAEFGLFTGGADWRGSARYDLVCPFADPRRAAFWSLAKAVGGALPKRRSLWEILAR